MGSPQNLTKAITKIKKVGASDQPPAEDALLSAERMRPFFFSRGSRTSAIAARNAGRRRGNGRDGRHSRDTAQRGPAKKSAPIKVGVIGSVSSTARAPDNIDRLMFAYFGTPRDTSSVTLTNG